jgi:pyrroloquinoline-quinone synthase
VSAGAFEARLRRIGEERYHHLHPFNLRMHAGLLSREEIQTWVRNRYYYQTRIPVKDSLILTKANEPAFRREWIQRIHDHDGARPGEGGLSMWLDLAEAVGLARDEVERCQAVLPGVRAAGDDYVRLVESRDLLESVAASLTEPPGPFMRVRPPRSQALPWVEEAGLEYFLSRTTQAPRDAKEGLAFVLAHATTPEDQERCAAALTRKCEILWALLDGVEWGGCKPRLAPAVLLRPEGEEVLAVLPERAVRISPSGKAIVAACDGVRDVEAVAAAIRAEHPTGERVEREVYEFIERMETLGVLALT